MANFVDLDRYPIDNLNSAGGRVLVKECQAQLAEMGMFNLPGFIKAEHLDKMLAEVLPTLNSDAFTHARRHNIYFKKTLPDVADDHPVRLEFETSNRTICADQVEGSMVVSLYDWPPFAAFLSAVMDLPALYPMDDRIACANVMGYSEGQALNWHFDRSEFTTTLLLQAPVEGGGFQYRSDLRSDDNPNYDGVARMLAGEDDLVRLLPLEAGTLNVFKGKNTAHRVTPVQGPKDRVIAVFCYYEDEGVKMSDKDKLGFYGRA